MHRFSEITASSADNRFIRRRVPDERRLFRGSSFARSRWVAVFHAKAGSTRRSAGRVCNSMPHLAWETSTRQKPRGSCVEGIGDPAFSFVLLSTVSRQVPLHGRSFAQRPSIPSSDRGGTSSGSPSASTHTARLARGCARNAALNTDRSGLDRSVAPPWHGTPKTHRDLAQALDPAETGGRSSRHTTPDEPLSADERVIFADAVHRPSGSYVGCWAAERVPVAVDRAADGIV